MPMERSISFRTRCYYTYLTNLIIMANYIVITVLTA